MSEKEAELSVKNEEQSIGRLTTMEAIKNKLYAGGRLTKAEVMELIEAPLEELCAAANDVRKHFCGNVFDVCTIINGKSGKCSENCKFCSPIALLPHESGCLLADRIGNDRRTGEIQRRARRAALFHRDLRQGAVQ